MPHASAANPAHVLLVAAASVSGESTKNSASTTAAPIAATYVASSIAMPRSSPCGRKMFVRAIKYSATIAAINPGSHAIGYEPHGV